MTANDTITMYEDNAGKITIAVAYEDGRAYAAMYYGREREAAADWLALVVNHEDPLADGWEGLDDPQGVIYECAEMNRELARLTYGEALSYANGAKYALGEHAETYGIDPGECCLAGLDVVSRLTDETE